MAIKIKDGIPTKRKINVKVGTGGSTVDTVAVLTGSAGSVTAVKAAAAMSAGTMLGIFTATADAGAYVDVELIDNHLVTASVTGSSKTSLVSTDLLTTFDLSDAATINLDDTTGGSFVYVGGYNSETGTADFAVTEAAKLI